MLVNSTISPYRLAEFCSPARLRSLPAHELPTAAAAVRDFLIQRVTAVGGHLGSNLGVVELTLALHRVFDSPRDTLLFDTGHQAYVHKIVTGRAAAFTSLRQQDGLSGYPSRAESAHDVIENSHASTALSYACGLACARRLTGEGERAVVAVVGDGSLTGGMAWEALNNIGCRPHEPVIVVLNDNGRSYAPTAGAIAHHLSRSRAAAPCRPSATVFEALGLDYLGPVDGHDIAALEAALRRARACGRPAVVHVITFKGCGYAPAVADEAEKMHAVGVLDEVTGRPPVGRPVTRASWTSVFSRSLVEAGRQRSDVVALTAAMPGPTGLSAFAERFPERFIDTGIAEQHTVTSAAGLALGGLHPVIALYSTFLSRAHDQVLMDVALHRAPVTFVLDRAGVTGPDGPSHHGMWDLGLLTSIPGMRVAAPRDGVRLAELFAEAIADDTGPTAVRFPKGSTPTPLKAVEEHGFYDILHRSGPDDVLLIAVGPLAEAAVAAARRLQATGTGVSVADPRWIHPVAADLVELAGRFRLVVSVEDHVAATGVGRSLHHALAARTAHVPFRALGLPNAFLPHAERSALLARAGLDAAGITASVQQALTDATLHAVR
ncbi:1-deoxy-D-xylulose-5-phosphate synthase [Streptomyces sp. SID8366]|uniref:1-deoxy-D-xylulose-5-phosphate synthase n=1 Tax=unclassified Streptomyces TaxID=2593676 RepID=UPI000DB9535F|nr:MULTISPECIES: 1-deoxy-D-xylulose-5-phosphate synthase [unclassified Streptomyces]MYU06085.1 1-deoxy-D-xylulose-5-phosphate synthase [Streptomyces sp. SID8366]MYU68045.1 1-deoxy-D-xylulose-5-phosphate synthase [Streptomyces sp. SID69]RAJ64153.1 1-deoxy-D-xylulose-5-phosphate synthase [Streptomyces sp. PsTaAH-130]